jgi:hypothetical protein
MVMHILMIESDHSGILIHTGTAGLIHRRGARGRPFRYVSG